MLTATATGPSITSQLCVTAELGGREAWKRTVVRRRRSTENLAYALRHGERALAGENAPGGNGALVTADLDSTPEYVRRTDQPQRR